MGTGGISWWVMWQWREAKNLGPFSTDVSDESTSIIFLHGVERGKFTSVGNTIIKYIFIQSSTTVVFYSIRSLIYRTKGNKLQGFWHWCKWDPIRIEIYVPYM
jgi:hypothetical protein